MADRAGIAAAVLEDLDRAGALADWLEENGEARLGRLLRLRWKRWRVERLAAELLVRRADEELVRPWRDLLARLKAGGATVSGRVEVRASREPIDRADESFRRYLTGRFGDPGVSDATPSE